MRSLAIDDCVRLTKDVPELMLKRGTVGIVCSTWGSPVEAYEVEFGPPGLDEMTRALLMAEQLEIDAMLEELCKGEKC